MLHEAKNQEKLQRGETIQQIQETFKTIRSKKQRKPRRQLTHETDSYADETYNLLTLSLETNYKIKQEGK